MRFPIQQIFRGNNCRSFWLKKSSLRVYLIYEKWLLFHVKNSLCSGDIIFLVFISSSYFCSVRHGWRNCWKKFSKSMILLKCLILIVHEKSRNAWTIWWGPPFGHSNTSSGLFFSFFFWSAKWNLFFELPLRSPILSDFLLTSAKKGKKRSIFNILRTITLERNIKSKQTTPVFSSTFYALSVSNNSFCFWKTLKFSFMGSPLWSQQYIFWSVNYTLNDQIRTININFWNLLNISFPSMYNMFIHQIVHAFRLISWTIFRINTNHFEKYFWNILFPSQTHLKCPIFVY